MKYTVYCKTTKKIIGEIDECGAVGLDTIFPSHFVFEPAESDELPQFEEFHNKNLEVLKTFNKCH